MMTFAAYIANSAIINKHFIKLTILENQDIQIVEWEDSEFDCKRKIFDDNVEEAKKFFREQCIYLLDNF